jgi:hypothetical protein
MFGSTFDFRQAKIERWKKLNYINIILSLLLTLYQPIII